MAKLSKRTEPPRQVPISEADFMAALEAGFPFDELLVTIHKHWPKQGRLPGRKPLSEEQKRFAKDSLTNRNLCVKRTLDYFERDKVALIVFNGSTPGRDWLYALVKEIKEENIVSENSIFRH